MTMTNLICAVIVTLATNWTTVSRTTPVMNHPQGMIYAVHLTTMLNQVGTRVTNYVALVAWKGRTNEVVLESVSDAAQEKLERSVPEPQGWPPTASSTSDTLYMPYNPSINWTHGYLVMTNANLTPIPGGIGWHVEN